MITKPMAFFVALTLAAPAAFAQQSRPQPEPPTYTANQRQMDLMYEQQRAASNNAKAFEWGFYQSWLDGVANQAKLRTKLAEAWQALGLSPQLAQTVAAAYQAGMATRMHHPSLRGKSDQEVAAMLQSAVAKKHYLAANQLLIDYQRQRLSLREIAAGAPHGELSGR